MPHSRILPYLAGIILLAAPTPASAIDSVAPGTTSASLNAIDCFYGSGALGDNSGLDCSPLVCTADCDAAFNESKMDLNFSNLTAGGRYVQSTVYTDFQVDPGTGGAGHELDGEIHYDVAWWGYWTLAGVVTSVNDVQSSVTLVLRDLTDDQLVKQRELHHENAQSAFSLPVDDNLPVGVDVGAHRDRDSTANALSVKLVRGHRYRIGLRLRGQGFGALNSAIHLDYISASNGARWKQMRVSVSPDLGERIDSLTARVDSLEQELLHHTHHYLTGRGEGHNNTVATTSEAIIQDDGAPSDQELRTLPALKGPARPLPIQSVIENSPDLGLAGMATIRYTLPEALHVTIRVYDALGRSVADVLDSSEPAGVHEAQFDARPLAAGVYYYRLLAGPYAESHRLTLIR